MLMVSAGTRHRACGSPFSNAFLRYWVDAPRDRGCATKHAAVSQNTTLNAGFLARFHPERLCAEMFSVEAGSSRSTEPACLHLPLSMESRGGCDEPHVFNACIIGLKYDTL